MIVCDVDICNLALDHLNQQNITSLEENTKAAKMPGQVRQDVKEISLMSSQYKFKMLSTMNVTDNLNQSSYSESAPTVLSAKQGYTLNQNKANKNLDNISTDGEAKIADIVSDTLNGVVFKNLSTYLTDNVFDYDTLSGDFQNNGFLYADIYAQINGKRIELNSFMQVSNMFGKFIITYQGEGEIVQFVVTHSGCTTYVFSGEVVE